MDWQDPPSVFRYVLLERVDPARNEARFYYLAWLPTLLGWAVIRVWGRKGGAQRVATPQPFDSLEEAWPTIRRHIKARLRHGYRVVESKSAGAGPAAANE